MNTPDELKPTRLRNRLDEVLRRKCIWEADKAATCTMLTVSHSMFSMYVRAKKELHARKD